jgi:hypothetical protein
MASWRYSAHRSRMKTTRHLGRERHRVRRRRVYKVFAVHRPLPDVTESGQAVPAAALYHRHLVAPAAQAEPLLKQGRSSAATGSVDPLSGPPQPLQNFCFAGFALPQEGQLSALAKGAAHSPQKLASAGFSDPQLMHRIDGHSGGQNDGTVDPRASYRQGTATGTA